MCLQTRIISVVIGGTVTVVIYSFNFCTVRTVVKATCDRGMTILSFGLKKSTNPSISSTFSIFQSSNGWLNDIAPLNTLFIFFTLLTSQRLSGSFEHLMTVPKARALLNIYSSYYSLANYWVVDERHWYSWTSQPYFVLAHIPLVMKAEAE